MENKGRRKLTDSPLLFYPLNNTLLSLTVPHKHAIIRSPDHAKSSHTPLKMVWYIFRQSLFIFLLDAQPGYIYVTTIYLARDENS